MKTIITLVTVTFMMTFAASCSINKNTQHVVRMVDAKSYMDHPPAAGIYYYK